LFQQDKGDQKDHREGVRKVCRVATFRWAVTSTAMASKSLDPYNSRTVFRFPGPSLGLSQKMHFRRREDKQCELSDEPKLLDVNHFTQPPRHQIHQLVTADTSIHSLAVKMTSSNLGFVCSPSSSTRRFRIAQTFSIGVSARQMSLCLGNLFGAEIAFVGAQIWLVC
jgi:hypothetical protein